MTEKPSSISQDRSQIPLIDANIIDKAPYFDQHPEDIRPQDLNNFLLWLSPVYEESFSQFSSYRGPRNIDSSTAAYHSQIFKDQSLADFFAAFKEALAHAPIDHSAVDSLLASQHAVRDQIIKIDSLLGNTPTPEVVEQLNDLRKELEEEHTHLDDQLREALIPMYQYLRQQGYSHYDLVA